MSDINKLKIFFNDTSAVTFTDLSETLFDYGRDSSTVAIESTDYIFIGRSKPFHSLYLEAGDTVNANSATMGAEYYNGTAWVALTLLVEGTASSGKTLARSGFIKWASPALWESTEINSTDKYWIRLQPSANLTATLKITGLNILYSDDEYLKRYVPDVMTMLPRDENDTKLGSFVMLHEAGRDKVLRELMRGGIRKNRASDGAVKPIDRWDLLDINDVKDAATFATLEVIFRNNSDTPEDSYASKAAFYKGEFKAAMEGAQIGIDFDDDGREDADEIGGSFYGTLSR